MQQTTNGDAVGAGNSVAVGRWIFCFKSRYAVQLRLYLLDSILLFLCRIMILFCFSEKEEAATTHRSAVARHQLGFGR